MNQYSIIGSQTLAGNSGDSTIDLILQTITQGKQILVFNNSKRSSESTAEKIAEHIKKVENKEILEELAKKILSSVSTPTKQCKKLSEIVEKGIAFHHSGLLPKQRDIIEKAFKEGYIKVISSTPTLAAGLNLPAYKVIIKDYKRYSSRGFADIPVLEYHQMSGRAGRPGKEDIGKTVLCVKSESELERVIPKYVFGKPEELISKLAVEPILKMYILSMISMNVTNTKKEITNFFSNTFYAYQYKDMDALNHNIFKIVDILIDYNFITEEDDYYMATPTGKKVCELYLNPDTAYYFIENIEKFFTKFSGANVSKYDILSLIYFIVNTIEMRPLFKISKAEEETYVKKAEDVGDSLLIKFNPYEMDYETYLDLLKTCDIFSDWINEAPEDYIFEKYKVTPGELLYKIGTIDWLLYALEEISLMKKNFFFRNYLNKMRIRFQNGIKEELLALISLKGIGRVRARKLHNAGLKKLSDLKKADFESISRVIGDTITIRIKEQLVELPDEHTDQMLDKPKEIKMREVSQDEVDHIVKHITEFEKEKEEKNKSLNDYFNF